MPSARASPSATAAAAAMMMIIAVMLCVTWTAPMMVSVAAAAAGAFPPVVLDFYIMAKCPDAEACVNTFYPALHPLIDIIDVRVNYIAQQLAPGSFSCMHGPTECQGTIDQLCVQHLYPKNLTWFDYLNCEEETRTTIPTNGPACAAQLGLSQSAIDTCHNSIGDALFNQSIARTDAAQETVSCTMNLNNAFWCQHNGDWVNCTEGTDVLSLIKAVCTRYQGTDKPAVCKSFDVAMAAEAAMEEREEKDDVEDEVEVTVNKIKPSQLPLSFRPWLKNVLVFSKN